jgi:hypothetical protein
MCMDVYSNVLCGLCVPLERVHECDGFLLGRPRKPSRCLDLNVRHPLEDVPHMCCSSLSIACCQECWQCMGDLDERIQ